MASPFRYSLSKTDFPDRPPPPMSSRRSVPTSGFAVHTGSGALTGGAIAAGGIVVSVTEDDRASRIRLTPELALEYAENLRSLALASMGGAEE